MKIKIILAIAILMIGLSGCSSENERNLVDEGQVALEKYEYTQAKELLSEALEIDAADEHARSMYIQATRMLNAKDYEEQQNYKKAIKELEAIEKIKNGSSAIKSEASTKKKELEKLQEEYEKAQAERKSNAKNTSSNDSYRVQKDALSEESKLKAEQNKKEEEKKEEEDKKEDNENNGNNTNGSNTGGEGQSTPKPEVIPPPVVSPPANTEQPTNNQVTPSQES
ncbi:MAG: tetratricopeptide repeat protein [Peptostreptococcaceae bacterium]